MRAKTNLPWFLHYKFNDTFIVKSSLRSSLLRQKCQIETNLCMLGTVSVQKEWTYNHKEIVLHGAIFKMAMTLIETLQV